MEIKSSIVFALCVLVGFSTPTFADSLLWQDIKPLAAKDMRAKNKLSNSILGSKYQQARYLSLNLEKMRARLSSKKLAAKDLRSKQGGALDSIDLPLPDGRLISVSIAENKLLPFSLSNKYPKMRMLNVTPDDFIVSGKLDVTASGFHAMLQTREGETLFIDPVTDSGESVYASYKKSDQQQSSDTAFSCSAHSQQEVLEKSLRSTALKPIARTQKSLINYRIAIAATGEYTAKHGGTVAGAMSAIATTINRVNQVFEQDLGIHLSLVENNDQLIYVDASTDPYSGNDSKEHLYQNQNNIDTIIGSGNYDIGHLFSASGGGLAAIGSVCNSSRKSQGISGVSNPRNDSFNLDFVAHEIGHQFGATHTFNGVQGLCSGSTRSARTAFEPGSGSTIMSYAGYCGGDNLQSNTDAMFHIGSIQQIRATVAEDRNSGCGIDNNITNASPKVEAGVNHVIPAQTPFELVGEATDAEGDALIYAWQQIDAGELSPVNSDRGDNAIFRVHPLSKNNTRSFPPIQNLLNHLSQRGENLPTQQRLMQFSLVVQDSHNTTQSDAMSVLVQRTGSRFALNLPRSQYSLGGTYKILWNVAGTDKAPVNCSSVDISLSVDGGYNFSQILGEDLPNMGEAWVTIPVTSPSTSQGRFKIRCSDNIFFAVSYRNFDVNSQNHSARLTFADEDQPELSLKDADIGTANDTKYAVPNQSEGGAINGLWLLMLLMLFRRPKTDSI
ncbi:MAG: zinc-dependent metalloprotease family protein [Thiotrichaceae bacterium]